MKKTKNETKETFISQVIEKLMSAGNDNAVKILSKRGDLSKRYRKAQRYERNMRAKAEEEEIVTSPIDKDTPTIKAAKKVRKEELTARYNSIVEGLKAIDEGLLVEDLEKTKKFINVLEDYTQRATTVINDHFKKKAERLIVELVKCKDYVDVEDFKRLLTAHEIGVIAA